MSEQPDFEQIARRLIALGGWDEEDDRPQDDLHRQAIAIQLAKTVQEVHLIWNARGAADAELFAGEMDERDIRERIATLNVT